jgi:hypothetical protein
MLYRPFEPSVESKPTIDTKTGGLGTSTKKKADKPKPTWLDQAGSAFEKAQARFGSPTPKPDPIKLYNKPEFTLPFGTTFPSGMGAFEDKDEERSTTGTMGISPEGDIVEYGLPEMIISDATAPYRAVPAQPAIQTGELAPAIQDTSDEEKQALIDMEEAALKHMASEGVGLMSPRLDGKDGAIVQDQTFDFDFETTSKRLVNDLKRDFGLTTIQASGLVGNLAFESGNFETLQEKDFVKGGKGGYGFAQWTDTKADSKRRTAFETWSISQGLDPRSYEANYGFLKKELSTNDPIIKNMGKNTIEKLKNTSSVDDATKVFMKGYLIPGKPHLNKRKDRANEVYRMFSLRPRARPSGLGG